MAFGPPDGARLRAGFLSDDELENDVRSRWSGGPANHLLGLNILRTVPDPSASNHRWNGFAPTQKGPRREVQDWAGPHHRGLFNADPQRFLAPTSYAGPAQLSEAYIDRTLAGPNDGGELIEIGSRSSSPRLRAEWERREGRKWPIDPKTGRPYQVAHIRALADGGTDTVDNIRPMLPGPHIAEHIESGDFERWGRRPHIARAFGGRVVRGLGPLGIASDILGIFSGRVRTDSFDNFANDMVGQPSREDRLKALEEQQRLLNPKWKRGDPIIDIA